MTFRQMTSQPKTIWWRNRSKRRRCRTNRICSDASSGILISFIFRTLRSNSNNLSNSFKNFQTLFYLLSFRPISVDAASPVAICWIRSCTASSTCPNRRSPVCRPKFPSSVRFASKNRRLPFPFENTSCFNTASNRRSRKSR